MSIETKPRRPAFALRQFFFPDLPHIQTDSHFNIPSLDGIRALSILIVLVSHCGLGKWVPGGFGVTIFFFLSGYLITTLMRREIGKTGTVSLRNFYIRRCLRILPPCYVVIAIALIVAIAWGEKLTWLGVFANVAYFTNYYECFGGKADIPGLGVLWSLAVEEHFYLIFPLIYLLISKTTRSRQGTVILLLCALVLAWRCVLVVKYDMAAVNPARTYTSTDTRVDSILWGCWFAIVCNPALGDRRAAQLANWWIGSVALGFLGVCLIVREPWFRETIRYTIQGIALMPLFALAIIKGKEGGFRALNSYGMRLLGIYSYTIYLAHFVVLSYLMPEPTPRFFPMAFALSLTISFIIAAVMYQFVDLPCAAIRKRYSKS
jgi:peptidoglycan/LPS O-acetylase OafA/YrhL